MVSSKRLPAAVRQSVRASGRDRCGYCQCQQKYSLVRLTISHLIPVSKGGTHNEENLWLVCSVCNRHKAAKITAVDPETGQIVPLFNPRTQTWHEYFRWSDDRSYVIGLTPVGRATVASLHLSDNPRINELRQKWVSLGWHPPKDD
jgi:hypothetical protein